MGRTQVSEMEVRDKEAIIMLFSPARRVVILLLAGFTIHCVLWYKVPGYQVFWTQSIGG